MSTTAPGRRVGAFARFRRTRPFWAGVFAIAGGLEIFILPFSPLASLVLLGVAGISSVVTGLVLVVMGLFMWFSPVNRTLAGVLTIIFALTSFVTSNLGGLVVGMVLGIIGGALCLAWTDRPSESGSRRRPRRSLRSRLRRDGEAGDPADDRPVAAPADQGDDDDLWTDTARRPFDDDNPTGPVT